MSVKLPLIYSQWDNRWAGLTLGNNSDSKFNIYNYGCLITDLAMVCKYYGKEETPQTINDKLKSVGGFVAGGGDYIYGSITKIHKDILEGVVPTPSELTNNQVDEIKVALDAGFPVMVQLDVNPKTVALDSHFVLLIDYNPNDENDFTIADPLGGKTRSLKDYLGWFRPSMRRTVEKYIVLKGKIPTVGADTVIVNKDELGHLRYRADQWEKSAKQFLGEDADPDVEKYEYLLGYVNGLKEAADKAVNEKSSALVELEIAKREIANQKDKVDNLTAAYEREATLLKTEIKGLDEARNILTEQIRLIEGELREAQKQSGIKDLEIARLKAEQPKNCLKALIEFLRNLGNSFRR